MNPSEIEAEAGAIVEVHRGDRWQVYLRLCQLEIPCSCATNQPLRVEVKDTLAAVQLWSVAKQLNSPRQELLGWLKQCWRISP